MHYRNVPSIYQPCDVQLDEGEVVTLWTIKNNEHPLIDNHPVNYPNDPDATKAIASTEEQEKRFWVPGVTAHGSYEVTV